MTTTSADVDQSVVDAFSERFFQAIIGAQQVQSIFLGTRLGWYRALSDNGPLTSRQLALHTNSNERYAREWLEQQAVNDILTVDSTEASPTERRYTLPPEHAELIVNSDSLNYSTPIAMMVASLGKHIDDFADAYKAGSGVSWEAYGEEVRDAQAAANRPMYLHALAQELLPQAPDLHAKLSKGARVADIGCGEGWSSIALARAYPDVTVHGFDVDSPSLDAARMSAYQFGVSQRVTFSDANAADVIDTNAYDVAFAFECIHDMPDPVAVLAAMKHMVSEDGYVVIMDELSEEHFTAPGPDLERILYGFSLMCCLPDGMSTQPSRATGTVMRPSTLEGYALEAGYKGVEILPIESDLFRFYRLRITDEET